MSDAHDHDPSTCGTCQKERTELRDRLAAAALTGLAVGFNDDEDGRYYHTVAEQAYAMADAMLNARDAKIGGGS